MGKNRTTTTNSEPWAAAQPALQEVIGSAQSLYNSGGMSPGVYGGDRVAEFSGVTQGAMHDLAAGSGLVNPATEALTGMFSDDNMYRDFDTIKSTVADDVKSQLGSTFSGGSVNSSLAQDAYTRAMTEALAGVEYGAYNDAQSRKLSALGLAPAVSDMALSEDRAALSVGNMQDQRNQALIDADMAEFRESSSADLDALRSYAGLAQGIGGVGGTSSQTQPVSFAETLMGIGRAASGIGGFWGAVS